MRSSRLIVLSVLFGAVSASVAGQGTATAPPTLRVGAARVEITPPLTPGSADQAYDHERLFVRAIVLDTGSTRAALIGADQGNLADDVWSVASKQIAAALGTPVAHVLMSATHTHSSAVTGPGQRVGGAGQPAVAAGGGRGAPATPAAPAVPALVAPIVQAVERARAALQPARFGYGTGASWLNVNRDAIDDETRKWTQAPNLDAPSDKTVRVMKFESTAGVPIAAYVTYAMHPVNGYLSGFVSADYPGAMSRYVEQAYGDQMVVVFAQGASGDQNPLYLRPGTNVMASRTNVPITGNVLVREKVEGPLRESTVPVRAPDVRVRDRLLRFIESQGQVLGEEVIRVMTNTRQLDGQPRIRAAQTVVSCPGRTRTNQGREGEPGTYADGDTVQMRLGAIVIGDTAIASINAEIYTLIGQRAVSRSPLSNTMVVGLANGRAGFGYIPDDSAYGHNTFQVLGTRVRPGCAETTIADGMAGLIRGLQ